MSTNPASVTVPSVYGYLGPEATFTHQALMQLPGVARAVPYPDVLAAIDAVSAGDVDAVLVPIENSVEGGVSATLDHLAAADGLYIHREVVLPVSFVLASQQEIPLDQITAVITHPVADAQVRGWLSTHLPGVAVRHVGSTAGAAQSIAAGETPGGAAVCARIAAETHGLAILADGIADNASAVTRFVVIGKDTSIPAPTGADKTTLVLHQRDDHSGALLEILEQFASRGINLSRLESRPTKTTLGSYCFSVDADGHLVDARMSEALMGLRRVCKDVRFLGSYPRADQQTVAVSYGATNEDFATAQRWLENLRAKTDQAGDK